MAVQGFPRTPSWPKPGPRCGLFAWRMGRMKCIWIPSPRWSFGSIAESRTSETVREDPTMNNPLFDMTDKVAVITGSTKGIGRSIAEEMARCGAKVVISSRKAEACEQVAEELKAQGFEAMAIPCHVGRKEDLQNLVDKTNEAWGSIDVLVCNAATNPVYGTTAEMTDDAWDKIMDTNVKGTFWLTNMVLPQMAEKGEGAVVLLSSIAGIRGNTTIGTDGGVATDTGNAGQEHHRTFTFLGHLRQHHVGE